MSTKVSLVWSGKLSRLAAEIFKNWLEIVIQELDIFYSEDDIAKGTNGIKTIFSNLQESVASVIMLTKENQTSPWICFEAGAMLSKKEEAPACGLLLDFSIAELEGPLKNLQQTTLEKKDVYKLLKTLNSKCSAPLAEERLKRAFNNNWEALYQDLTSLIKRESEKKPTHRPRKQGTTKDKGSKRDLHTGQKQKVHEQFSHDIWDNFDGILRLLNRAFTYHELNNTWRAAAMRQALRVTKSHAELLIELCIKGGLISMSYDDAHKNASAPYVYKLTAKGIDLLNRINGRR